MTAESELQERIRRYPWYHSIEVAEGITTPGVERHRESQERSLRLLHSLDLRGKRVLDIGCRDGLFSFEAERMGAREVIGIDNDLSRGAVELLIPYFGSRVRMVELNLLDLGQETFGLFDAVLFFGVLYHLRYPIWSLKLIRDVLRPGGHLLIETAVLVDDNRYALMHVPKHPEGPYPGIDAVTFFNVKGLVDTLETLGIAGEVIEAPGDPATMRQEQGRLPVHRVTLRCTRLAAAPAPEALRRWERTYHREDWQ